MQSRVCDEQNDHHITKTIWVVESSIWAEKKTHTTIQRQICFEKKHPEPWLGERFAYLISGVHNCPASGCGSIRTEFIQVWTSRRKLRNILELSTAVKKFAVPFLITWTPTTVTRLEAIFNSETQLLLFENQL